MTHRIVKPSIAERFIHEVPRFFGGWLATLREAARRIAALPGGGWLAGGEFGSYNGFNQRYLVKVLPESLVQPHTAPARPKCR